MANTKYTIPRGTHDILPNQSYRWQIVEHLARQVAGLFGCLEIRTPTFEHTDLFLRSIGDGTDVVSKEMYSFFDKSNPPTHLTLKPEGTAGVARSFVENNLEALGLPLKMYYLTPIYRYEKPQKGRYRQHHQFGVEFYGSSSPFMDYEVILLAYMLLTKFGLNDIILNINSIGCDHCRSQFINALQKFVLSQKDSFCDTCQERVQKNTLRVLDCKVSQCKQHLQNAPIINDFLCDECIAHHNTLLQQLQKNNIPYQQNTNLVRGLDYYNRTVFEWITRSNSLGNQSTVCGGGRYDNLVQSVGGKPTACAGFGMGLERIIHLIDEQNPTLFVQPTVDIFVMYASQEQAECAFEIANILRSNNISTQVDYTNKSLKSQFKNADRIQAKYALVIGADEVTTQKATLRNMQDKTERLVDLTKISNFQL